MAQNNQNLRQPDLETSALLGNVADDQSVPTSQDISQSLAHYGSTQQPERLTGTLSSFHSSNFTLYLYLYLSHLLSTWNSRVLEYGAALFLSSLFPNTFVPLSLYALFRSLSSIIFSHLVGRYIDTNNRLTVVRTSIVYQRLAIAVSCVGLWAMEVDIGRSKQAGESIYTTQIISLMVLIIACACAERLCSTMNMVAVERDWVVVLSKSKILQESFNPSSSTHSQDSASKSALLQLLNARMRRIDLFCKLIGPLAFSYLYAYFNLVTCLWTLLIWNLVSMVIEYATIENVYRRCPELHVPKLESNAPKDNTPGNNATSSELPNEPQTSRTKASSVASSVFQNFRKNYILPFRFYFSHPMALASFSLALLYLTVLSFGAQTVSFLLFAGFSPIDVGYLRTVSVICELSATFIAPFAMSKIGPRKTGLFFVIWQALCLVAGLTIAWPVLNWSSSSGLLPYLLKTTDSLKVSNVFQGIDNTFVELTPQSAIDLPSSPKALLYAFVFAIIFSRIGLWGFDLSIQVLIQEGVSNDVQARFSSTESACQAFFDLLSYFQTLVWSSPKQFRWPATSSATVTVVAAVVYFLFLTTRRGSH